MKNPEQGITMEHKSFNRIEFYQWMLILRRFEERAKAIYRTGMLQGALHLYIGEEAVAVGVCSVLRDDDYIFSTHRSHGHYLAKTHDVNGAMAELLGRATGCSRGHGGSMHMFNRGKGFLGSNGIVGGGFRWQWVRHLQKNFMGKLQSAPLFSEMARQIRVFCMRH